jgi:Uma2 family endonuclease
MLAEADIAPDTPYRLTVKDFELLADSGAFDSNPRVELIEGEIIVMAPLHKPHAAAQAELIIRLGLALRNVAPELRVASTPSLAVAANSMPMPDILILPASALTDGPVDHEEALLVVEVTYATSRMDLGVKVHLYGNAGVPEYWVFDMKGGEVHVFSSPEQGGYSQHRVERLGHSIDSETIAGLAIDTSDLI